jgi:hypothetical protein
LISLHAVQRENEGFRRFVVLFLIRQQNHSFAGGLGTKPLSGFSIY